MLYTYAPSTKLSTHFIMKEVIQSTTADKLKIINIPQTDEIWFNAQQLAVNVLDPIRSHFNLSFSPQSWFRCEELEREITKTGFANWCTKRGVNPTDSTSWDNYFRLKSHPQGQACDIEIPGIDNNTLYDWIGNNLKFDQLIREAANTKDPRSGWVHVSWRSAASNRNEMFKL